MDLSIACPTCARRLKVPRVHLGKKVRCPGCGTVFASETAASRPPSAAVGDTGPADPFRAPAATDLGKPARPKYQIGVKVKRDPRKRLSGAYSAELTDRGLVLSRPRKNEEILVRVGVSADYLGGSGLAADIDGRDVCLELTGTRLYTPRLAADVASFLQRKRARPDLADYAIPGPLLAAVMAPFACMAVGITGGMIGGAIGGALSGLFSMINLNIARREKYSVGVRLAACVMVSLVSFAGFGAAAFAVVSALRPATFPVAQPDTPDFGQGGGVASTEGSSESSDGTPPPAPPGGWGQPEDPDGDCQFRIVEGLATIGVPGSVHDLLLRSGRTNAPRIVRKVEGDFRVEVTLDGQDEIASPPAPGGQVAFHGAGLLVWCGPGEFLRLERASLERDGKLIRYVLLDHQLENGLVEDQEAPLEASRITLRLERVGTEVRAEYRPEGRPWVKLAPKTLQSVPTHVGVAAVNTAAAPFLARFEGYRLDGRGTNSTE